MMRWVEWRDAMKKGGRERLRLTTHSPRHRALRPRSQKLSLGSGETGSTIPTCLRQQAHTPSALRPIQESAEAEAEAEVARQRIHMPKNQARCSPRHIVTVRG